MLHFMGSQSRTRLNDFTFTFHFHALEKEMTTHSSVLAWRIPGTGEPGGCRLWGCTESDTTEATEHQLTKGRVKNSHKPLDHLSYHWSWSGKWLLLAVSSISRVTLL